MKRACQTIQEFQLIITERRSVIHQSTRIPALLNDAI